MSNAIDSLNVIHQLNNRESGLLHNFDYDYVLGRLRVRREDCWRGIVPSSYVSDYNPEPPIFSAKFAECNQYRHILAIANEDGKIALQDTTTRNYEIEERALAAPQCHYNAIFDLEWQPGETRFVSASGDHTSRLWDVSGNDIRCITSFLGHTRSVKTVAFRKEDNSVFATGGRDGAIIVWDMRVSQDLKTTSTTDNCIFSGHVSGVTTPTSHRRRPRAAKTPMNMPSSSVTGLVFQDSNTLISCGATDGIIKIWDLRRNYSAYRKEPQPKYSLPYAGSSTFKGYTNLLTDKAGSRLFASCMDNTIYCFNISSYETKPIALYKGVQIGTFYIKSCLSPDGKYLVSGSSDECAYIWNLKHPDEPLLRLNGHRVEVTCVAWGATHDFPLVTCSDDARHKIWRIGPTTITPDELLEHYSGYAEYIKPLNKKRNKEKLQLLRVKNSEEDKTNLIPTTSQVVNARKRRLSNNLSTIMEQQSDENEAEMENAENHQAAKRPRRVEVRGRILFGPLNSEAFASEDDLGNRDNNDQSSLRPTHSNKMLESRKSDNKTVETVKEDLNTKNSNQSYNDMSLITKQVNCEISTKDERDNNEEKTNSLHYMKHLAIRTDNILTTNNYSPAIFSPTSNLPNYVVDGEAPHLTRRSPSKKRRNKVDWLTNIRKQKLLAVSNHTPAPNRNENSQRESVNTTSNVRNTLDSKSTNTGNIVSSTKDILLNASCLRTAHPLFSDQTPEESNNLIDNVMLCSESTTNNGNSERRRNSETTLLRFFTIQKPGSNSTEGKIISAKTEQKVDDDINSSLSILRPTTATSTMATAKIENLSSFT